MNINKVLTKDYEKRTLGVRGKNKPNTKPNKANLPSPSDETNPIQTQYKPNQTQFQTGPVRILVNYLSRSKMEFANRQENAEFAVRKKNGPALIRLGPFLFYIYIKPQPGQRTLTIRILQLPRRGGRITLSHPHNSRRLKLTTPPLSPRFRLLLYVLIKRLHYISVSGLILPLRFFLISQGKNADMRISHLHRGCQATIYSLRKTF
jgi:hypothetical protein